MVRERRGFQDLQVNTVTRSFTNTRGGPDRGKALKRILTQPDWLQTSLLGQSSVSRIYTEKYKTNPHIVLYNHTHCELGVYTESDITQTHN